MNMPGFTAEASLYKMSGNYRMIGTFDQGGEAIRPASCDRGCISYCQNQLRNCDNTCYPTDRWCLSWCYNEVYRFCLIYTCGCPG